MANTPTEIGPNVKKLIAHKMTLYAIPMGGGVTDGLEFLSDPKRISADAKRAMKWVQLAIGLLRRAAEPNPWKTATDEEIAGELLQRVEERLAKGT